MFSIKSLRQTWPLALLFMMVFLASCDKDDPEPFDTDPFSNGVLVLNEGNFSSPSSLSFFFADSLSTQNEVYAQQNNGTPLGQLAQSIAAFNDDYFVMVSNSNKVEVLDNTDLTSKASISGIELPRYFLGLNNLGAQDACITYWSADGLEGGVAFINLSDYSVTNTVTTGNGPENMLVKDGKLYVANAGGFGKDSTIVAIDLATQMITETITVAEGPAFMHEVNGDIYVLCKGVYDANINDLTPGALVRISNNQVVASQQLTGYPDKLVKGASAAGRTDLYYLKSDGVYKLTVIDGVAGLPVAQKIVNGYYYGLSYDDENSQLLLGNPGDFATPGWMVRCGLDGVRVDSFQVGIAPNYFLMK